MDHTHWSFSTFSTNIPRDRFPIFHHATNHWIMWSHCHKIPKRVLWFKLIHCTGLFHVGPLDLNHFDGSLNCSIDFTYILNYLIPWDIDYTEACTTPITQIQTPRVNTHQISIAATITSSIESNNLHVKQIESIQVNHVGQVPPRAIWLRRQKKKVYSSLDPAYRDDISGSDAEMRLTMVPSIVDGLQQRLMPLLDDHHTSSLTYWPCCKRLDQRKKPLNAWFSILNSEKTLQPCGNAICSWLYVAIWTRPHPEKHCIISWWLILSPPCGPTATNHMSCLLVALERGHRNCYCIVPNVFCIVETTDILIVIDILCEGGKSLKTPSNVIL